MREKLITWMEGVIPWLLSHGIRIVLIIGAALLIGAVMQRVIRRAVRVAVASDTTSSETGRQKREKTLAQIFSGAFRIVLITIATLMVLQEAGIHIAPILAGAGIVGIAVGFGGQYLIRDMITGLFIILENQYRVGDIVNLDGTSGMVEKISLRLTTLRDLDGTMHHIPNGEIKRASNLSKSFSRVNMNIGISYSADIDLAEKVINETGAMMAADPEWKADITLAPAFVRIDSFGDSSVNIKIIGETLPGRQWDVAGEFRRRIKKAFDEAGIEIPFPQMVIHRPEK